MRAQTQPALAGQSIGAATRTRPEKLAQQLLWCESQTVRTLVLQWDGKAQNSVLVLLHWSCGS